MNLDDMNLEHGVTEESTSGRTVLAAPKAAATDTIRTPAVVDAVRSALEETADIRQVRWRENEMWRHGEGSYNVSWTVPLTVPFPQGRSEK
jgi:hypothetical protein